MDYLDIMEGGRAAHLRFLNPRIHGQVRCAEQPGYARRLDLLVCKDLHIQAPSCSLAGVDDSSPPRTGAGASKVFSAPRSHVDLGRVVIHSVHLARTRYPRGQHRPRVQGGGRRRASENRSAPALQCGSGIGRCFKVWSTRVDWVHKASVG